MTATVPIDQRFAQLIQQFGLTKNSFAMSLGKTASVVQHLIDGRNKPGFDLLCKVFEIYPNVSRDWLLLGRGPMLVSGEPTPKAPVHPVAAPVSQLPLEPIDLSDIDVHPRRRSGPGVAGSRLQPDEIAATLALAASANQPSRTAAAHPGTPHESTNAGTAMLNGASLETQVSQASPAAVAEAPVALPASPAPTIPDPVSAPAYSPQPVPPAVPAAPNAGQGLSPETYVAAALHAQHLQHQLALAELRNQHLLEQQQTLREMLAMARQAMV